MSDTPQTSMIKGLWDTLGPTPTNIRRCRDNALSFSKILGALGGHRGGSLIARLMGPTWGPAGADRTQVEPMFPPWILLSGIAWILMWARAENAFCDSKYRYINVVSIDTQIKWLYMNICNNSRQSCLHTNFCVNATDFYILGGNKAFNMSTFSILGRLML